MKPFRIAIVAEHGHAFEDWEVRLFNAIVQDPNLDLTAIYRVRARPHPSKGMPASTRLILSLEKRLIPALSTVAAITPIHGLPEVDATDPTIAGASDIGHPDLLLLHVDSGRPEVDSFPQTDVWGYSIYEDGIAQSFGASAVAAGEPLTQIELLSFTPDGREVIECSPTNTKFLGAFNEAYAKDKLVPIVLRELRFRSRGIRRSSQQKSIATVAQQRTPAKLSYGSHALKSILGRAVDSFAKRIGKPGDDWSLVVGSGDVLTHSLADLAELDKPNDEFWADPFLFERAEKTYVFFEACSYKTRLGRICVGQLIDNAIHDINNIDLGPIHASYPFVFEHDGAIFMVPEVHQRKRVEVWRSTGFPHEWQLHATALEGQAPVDTAIFAHGGHWWLSTNIGSGRFIDPGQELHIFRIDGPDLKRVETHAMNPVVIGADARNGGRPFVREGRLYRPAQLAAYGRYGHGIRIKEVTELDIETYSERTVRSIDPVSSAGTSGCHHLDASEERFILDARRDFPFHLRVKRPFALTSHSSSERAASNTYFP